MRVLVVDDSTTMRLIIANLLKGLHFTEDQIVHATDGEEALQQILSLPFSLILMDWNMPNLLGIDTVKAIRKAGVTTPIIMITTEAERHNVIQAIEAGANNYLVKPFTEESFCTKITQLIGKLPPAPEKPPPRREFTQHKPPPFPTDWLENNEIIFDTAPESASPHEEKAIMDKHEDKEKSMGLLEFPTRLSPEDVLLIIAQGAKEAGFDIFYLSNEDQYVVLSDQQTLTSLPHLYPVFMTKEENRFYEFTMVEVGIKSQLKQNNKYNIVTKTKHEKCFETLKTLVLNYEK